MLYLLGKLFLAIDKAPKWPRKAVTETGHVMQTLIWPIYFSLMELD